MPHLSSIELNNVVTFKHARFKVDAQPLAVIRGRNLDRTNKKSANAVGKTLLAHCVPNVLYFTPPLGIKNAASDLIGAGSSITLHLKNEQHTHKIKQYGVGKQVRYSIFRDGADTGITKIKDAKEYISKLVPPEDQLYTTAFISPRDFNVLVRGKTEQRFDFFENVCNLRAYDRMQAIIAADYNAIKVEAQKLDILKANQTTIGKFDNISQAKRKLRVFNKKMKAIQKKIGVYQEALQDINKYLAAAVDLDTETPIEDIKNRLVYWQQQHATLTADYEKAIKLESRNKQVRLVQAKLNALEEKMNNIPAASVLMNAAELDAEYDNTHQKVIDLEKKVRATEEQIATVESLNQAVDRINLPLKWQKKSATLSTKKINKFRIQAESKIKQNNKIIQGFSVLLKHDEHEHGHGHQHGKDKNKKSPASVCCPTCQQTVDIQQVRQLVGNLQTENKSLNTKIAVLDSLVPYKELQDQLAGLPSLKRLNKQLTQYKSQLESAEHFYFLAMQNRAGHKRWLEIKGQQEQLKSLLKPIKDYKNPIELKSDIENAARKIGAAKYTLKRRKILQTCKDFGSYDKAVKLRNKCRKFIAKFEPKLSAATNTYSQLAIKIARKKDNLQKFKELQKEIDQLRASTKDLAIYAALKEAYGAKGLRVLHIRNIASMYAERLNSFAHMFYSEPIKFSTNVQKGRFDIMAERNGKISDVRRLSGAESTGFILLSMLALLPFVPEKSRVNFLFIDEPETGMDEPSLKKLTSELLPALNAVIPNIVVITPKSMEELHIPNAVEYLITKEKGISTLTKIKPTKVKT